MQWIPESEFLDDKADPLNIKSSVKCCKFLDSYFQSPLSVTSLVLVTQSHHYEDKMLGSEALSMVRRELFAFSRDA